MNLIQLGSLLADLIKDSGFEGKCYFAGGCVRDYLLGNGVGLDSRLRGNDKVSSSGNVTEFDIDICVNMPEGGMKLADLVYKRLNGKNLKKHTTFGTAGFYWQDMRLEFVATRKETYPKGSRYPKVQFGSLEDDVLRRDFTINALLMEIGSGRVLDLCKQGISDLENGIIRTVAKPDTSFSQDPLRMLRAMRFALRFGFKLEEQTQQALRTNAKLINNLSKRLRQQEVEKMLKFSTPEEVEALVRELVKAGVDIAYPNYKLT